MPIKDLKRFATEDWPLHPSGLGAMVQCPWRVVMEYLFGSTDEGGPAANTGSAMHRAAQAFHEGRPLAECLEVMQAEVHKYPRADLQDAAGLFLNYAADPRNRAVDGSWPLRLLLCEIGRAHV